MAGGSIYVTRPYIHIFTTKIGEKGKKWAQEKSWKTHEFQPTTAGSSGGCDGGALSEGDAKFLLPWPDGGSETHNAGDRESLGAN